MHSHPWFPKVFLNCHVEPSLHFTCNYWTNKLIQNPNCHNSSPWMALCTFEQVILSNWVIQVKVMSTNTIFTLSRTFNFHTSSIQTIHGKHRQLYTLLEKIILACFLENSQLEDQIAKNKYACKICSRTIFSFFKFKDIYRGSSRHLKYDLIYVYFFKIWEW